MTQWMERRLWAAGHGAGRRRGAGRLAAGLLLAVGLAGWLAPGGARAADGEAAQALPPVEMFFRGPDISEYQLSPSGKYLALVMARPGPRSSLVVIELGAQSQARRIAQYADADILGVQWMDDERLLFRLRDLSLGSGEAQEQLAGLHSIRADGSEVRILISRNRSTAAPYPVLSWGHRLLQVPAPGTEGVQPDEVIVGKPETSGIHLLGITPRWFNVATGLSRPIDMPEPPARALRWWFDSRGRPRLLQTVSETRDAREVPTVALYWLDSGASQWRPLMQGSALKLRIDPLAVDDQDTLYVLNEEDPGGYATLTRYDREHMTPEEQPLLRTPGFDFAGGLVMAPGGGRLLGVRVDTDAEQTVWFDPAHRAMQEEADRRWPGRVNRLQCRRCGTPEAVVLLRSSSDRDPGQLMVYQARDRSWRHVAALHEGLLPRQMGAVELVRIQARDGQDLPVWLTHPAGVKPGQAAPAVVLVHGGPWLRGGRWQWSGLEQFLASRGYLVISPDFRGSWGYGQAHYRAGWKQWGLAMQDDLADALLWAQAQGLATGEACIAGASYGGYATLMGLARHPQLYRCGVAWAAVSDLMLYVKGAWWLGDDVSAVGRRHLLPDLVGDPGKDEAFLQAHSPVRQAARIRAPLLLAHGEEDQRVPEIHARRMRDALTDQGRTPQWVTYAKEGHGWGKLATHQDFAQRMEAFLLEHLGPGARGDAPAPAASAPLRP